MEITLLHRKEHPINVSPENPTYRKEAAHITRSETDRRAGSGNRRIADGPNAFDMIPRRRWREDRRLSGERRKG